MADASIPTAAAYEAALDRAVDRSVWRRIQAVEETGSTNTDLKELGWRGERPGRLLVAVRQSGGRGTQGRVWHAPAGGVYLSALAGMPDPETHLVGILAALAAAHAVETRTGLVPSLKWPNDIILDGRKLGGVLVEHWSAREGCKANLVIGVGLNANLDPGAFPPELRDETATLRAALGRDVDLPALAAEVANNLAEELRLLRKGDAKRLVRLAEERLLWRGEPVAVHTADRMHRGRLTGLSSDGALRLEDDAGRITEHWSGRCSLLASLLLFFACLVFGGGRAHADKLHLDNGAVLEGRIEEVEGGYEVHTGTGRFFVKADRVEEIERLAPVETAYARRVEAADPHDADAQYVLALWCREQGLKKEAERHFTRVFRIDPDHEEARRSAGHRRLDGEWIDHAEYMRRKGYARYGGRWRPKEEAERLRRRDERRRRCREASARARKLLATAPSLEGEAAFRALGDDLAALGEHALPALRQGAAERDPRVRAVAYLALAALPEAETAEALCDRLRREPHRRLQRGLATLLADHPARGSILRDLVGRILRNERRVTRQRYAYALATIGDPAVIPMLVEKASYTPTKGQATDLALAKAAGDAAAGAAAKDDASGGKDLPAWLGERPDMDHLPEGMEATRREGRTLAEENDHATTTVYYPAAEALVDLTGMDFGRDAEAWAAWWATAQHDFAFARVELPRPRRRDDRPSMLGDNTLRAEMLRQDGVIE